MKTRHVYLTDNLTVARAAMTAARNQGIADNDLMLVARGDIEERRIPDRRKEADSDMKPALMRGMLIGLVLGAIVAWIISLMTSIPLTAMLMVGGAIGGMLLGGLGATLSGAATPDPIRRQFSTQIEAGKVLLVVDAENEVLKAAHAAIEASGATQLPYASAVSAT